MKRLLLVLMLAGVLLFVAAPVALARGLAEDRVVFGDDVTIGEGERVDGNLVVFGGDVTIEEGAEVTNNVVMFGGTVSIDGRVGGDVTLFGGSGHLGESAEVDGRLVTAGGNVSRDEGAVIRGGHSQGFDFDGPPRFDFQPFDFGLSLFAQAVRAVLTSIAIAALALLVLLFWPLQTARVAETIESQPARSGGFGVLTWIAATILLVLLALTICLIPFSIIGGLILAAATLFGWIALGLVVGNRLLTGLNVRNFTPAVSAGVGTLLISLLSEIFGLIPCIGWLIPILLSAIGLGAVVLTRFGTRPYFPPGPGPAAPVPIQPSPPPPASETTVSGPESPIEPGA